VYVHCYPVQNEKDWQTMLDYGVDVIQTDYPEALMEYFNEKDLR
jgi:glycerophosphoryl diester phosphodiesterase